MNSIICPISTKRIDNNVSRITVFISVVFMAFFIYTRNPIYMIIVTIDTMIRAVIDVKYSPLKQMSSQAIRVMKWKEELIDLAKKIFASRLGMLCGVASILLFYFELETASFIVAAIWLVLGILDSVFNFCLGCIIYSYLVFPFYKSN